MDPRVHNKGSYSSAAPKIKQKKSHNKSDLSSVPVMKKNNSVHGQTNQQKNYQNFPKSNFGYVPQKHYPAWSTFNEGISVRKGSFDHSSGKSSQKQNHQLNHFKNLQATYAKGYMSDKNMRYNQTTTGSDSDSNALSSELNGFKIVQNGKIVHDETHREVEPVAKVNVLSREDLLKERFASSQLTIGPNAKEISIPIFVES